MGFTTGFLGGFTLTSSILYLTIALHTKNRLTQAALLRQQRALLTNVIDPPAPQAEPVAREINVGLAEMAKDQWNRSIENGLRSVYETDWRRTREEIVDWADGLLSKIKS